MNEVSNFRCADAAEVQTIVATNAIGRDVNALKGEIWQAEGQVQLATAQAQIANLQGQANVIAAIGTAAKDAAVANALTNSQIALGTASTAALVNEAKFDIAKVVVDENAKTREMIHDNLVAQLNRELGVAQVKLSEAHADHRHAQTEVNVTQTVNQAQTQNNLMLQVQNLLTGQAVLMAKLQENTQSTVAIGSTLTGNAQTATNNKVS